MRRTASPPDEHKAVILPPLSDAHGNFTAAEKIVDAAIHVLAILGSAIVLLILLAERQAGAPVRNYVALGVYGVGLFGMLVMSLLYNMSPPGRRKAVLRTCDRAMIFVMIAGSYTPFAIAACPPLLGGILCAVIWSMAALGVGLCIAWRRLYERISVAFYLAMGWMVLAVLPALAEAVSATVLALLIGGGVVYSLGVIIHTRVRVAFHNAAWHGMVVTAAALHLAAIALILP